MGINTHIMREVNMAIRPDDYTDPYNAPHKLKTYITEEEKQAFDNSVVRHPMSILKNMYESEDYKAEVAEAVAPYVEKCESSNVKRPCSVYIAFFEAEASVAEQLAAKYKVSKSTIGRALVLMSLEKR